MKFVIGTCLLINSYYYQVADVIPNNLYYLKQSLIVFDEPAFAFELNKKEWVEAYAKKVDCKKLKKER